MSAPVLAVMENQRFFTKPLARVKGTSMEICPAGTWTALATCTLGSLAVSRTVVADVEGTFNCTWSVSAVVKMGVSAN